MEVKSHEPRTDELIAIAAALLENPDLDADCNFIEEGGSSILAAELDETVFARFGKKLDFQRLYRCTFGEVAEDLFGSPTG